MTEIAVFRKLQGGTTSYFITIAEKLLPRADKLTLTLAKWEDGKTISEHIVKRKGRAKIHNSLKITINREIVDDLGIKKGDVVWVRILPFTEKPPDPPRTPYIARPVRIHSDKSSLFFTIAKKQIDYIHEAGAKGRNLHVFVRTPDGIEIDYIKRPILVRRDKLYKVILPMELFYGIVHSHDTVHVKIFVTDKPEELFYTG